MDYFKTLVVLVLNNLVAYWRKSGRIIKEANELLAEKFRAFNDRLLAIAPSLTRRALFEGKEREF